MSERRSVLVYGINYAPEVTGVGRYTADLARYLAQTGFSVEVVTAIPHYPGWRIHIGFKNWFSQTTEDAVRVWRCPIITREKSFGIWRIIPPLSFAIFSAPIAAWRILRKRPATVLCIEPTLLSAPLALLASKLVGAKIFLHVQDLEFDAAFSVGHLKSPALQRVALYTERFILRRFDKIVTISRQMRARILNKGIDGDRIEIIRNWVDLKKIKPLNEPSIYRKELGFSAADFVALYAGNIGLKQALPVLLEAARKLEGQSRIKFVIVGDGPEKKRLIDQFGSLRNVIFLPVQAEDRLCDLLNLPDVHILPSQSGTADIVLPSKLGGMLASGKPSIIMADPGTELYEFVGTEAIMVPTGNVTALAVAIDAASGSVLSESLPAESDCLRELNAEWNLKAFGLLMLGAQEA